MSNAGEKMSENIEETKRSDEVGEFAKEVYQQCVDKGWSVGDFRLFAQIINVRKESALSDACQYLGIKF